MSREDAQTTHTETIKGWLKDIMYGVEDHEWGSVVEEE